MKRFKELILTEDTVFNESIAVEGDIRGYYNLKVIGNIDAQNIDAWNINAWDINAWDINAWDINAWDINVWNINAWDIDALNINALNINALNINALNINAWNGIFCETVRLKDKSKGKIRARYVIRNRSKLEQKEWEGD